MFAAIVMVLAGGLAGQRGDAPPFFREWGQRMTYYYRSPDPELGPAMLKDLLKKENIGHPRLANDEHLLLLIGAQLGDIAAGKGKAKVVREYEGAFADASTAGRRVIARALTNCGDEETLKRVDAWLGDKRYDDVRPELKELRAHLQDPKRKHVRDRPARTPEDLDFLWVNFFITGDYAPVSRILDVFDRPGAREDEVLFRVAKWSLGSNLQQHPKLVSLVEQHARERPEGSGSRKVIGQLIVKPPGGDDAKAVAARKAVLVGKWVSDDDEKIPLEFLDDGTAKVGFYKEKDAWVIAKGTYTVSGDGSVRADVRYEGSTLSASWTLKDKSLLGSHGPRADVRWVKVKDEEKKEEKK
jgi:uncharacterized protein (TIGR03066 family)